MKKGQNVEPVDGEEVEQPTHEQGQGVTPMNMEEVSQPEKEKEEIAEPIEVEMEIGTVQTQGQETEAMEVEKQTVEIERKLSIRKEDIVVLIEDQEEEQKPLSQAYYLRREISDDWVPLRTLDSEPEVVEDEGRLQRKPRNRRLAFVEIGPIVHAAETVPQNVVTGATTPPAAETTQQEEEIDERRIRRERK